MKKRKLYQKMRALAFSAVLMLEPVAGSVIALYAEEVSVEEEAVAEDIVDLGSSETAAFGERLLTGGEQEEALPDEESSRIALEMEEAAADPEGMMLEEDGEIIEEETVVEPDADGMGEMPGSETINREAVIDESLDASEESARFNGPEEYVDNHLRAWAADSEDESNFLSLCKPAGSEVLLRVTAAADDMSGLAYSWTDNDEEAGEGTAEYTVSNLDQYHYVSCEVTDRYGTSVCVHFEICKENHLKAWAADFQEESDCLTVSVSAGSKVTLKVSAEADDMSALAYRWSDNEELVEEERAEYTISSLDKNHYVTCRVEDQYGNSADVYFNVSVENHLRAWTEYPADEYGDIHLYRAAGSKVTLKVSAEADDMSALAYHWKDNEEIVQEERAEYTISSLDKNHYVICSVEDQYGNSADVYFGVSVENHLRAWTEYPADEYGDIHLYRAAGSKVLLKVLAEADDMSRLTYHWDDNEKTVQEERAEYTISSLDKNHDVICRVEDHYGNSAYVSFYVHVENRLRAWAVSSGAEQSAFTEIYKKKGSVVNLAVQASAVDDSQLRYFWYDDSLSGEESGLDYIEGSASYVSHRLYSGRKFTCVVKDQYNGEAKVVFVVHVTEDDCEHIVEVMPDKKPTCEEAGHTGGKVCRICGKVLEEAEEIPATGHTETVIPGKAPTCEKPGLTPGKKCSVCGKILEPQKAIPATGHRYGKYTVTREATVLQTGIETRRCSVCGKTQTRVIPKKPAVIKLNTYSIPLKTGQSTTAVRVTQMGRGDRIAGWTSSNAKVASVSSSGKIKAGKKTGKAVITVKLASGISAQVKVKVQAKKVTAKKALNLPKSVTLKKGRKLTLSPQVEPVTVADKVKYSSSKKSVAKISKKGVITAKKAGTAVIQVKYGSKTFKVKVKVTK